MPVRSPNQRVGADGERLVKRLFADHDLWVPRDQNEDFGIDFEVELADHAAGGQRMTGRLLKVQVKTSARFRRTGDDLAVSIEREWIRYASEIRVPVILAAVDDVSGEVWWVWMQGWAMLNEDRLARRGGVTATIAIPLSQTLDRNALGTALPEVAEGRSPSAMVLALRGVLEVAQGWENQEIARGVVELLARTRTPSRDWMIGKVVDELIRHGPSVSYGRAQQMLPILLALVDTGGDALSSEQILRIVQRGDTYSRVGVNALEHLYDEWPDHAATLGLPRAFLEAGLTGVAWYAAMRERFPKRRMFGLTLTNEPDQDFEFFGLTLRLDRDLRDHLMSKWPNRGDTVLIDALFEAPRAG